MFYHIALFFKGGSPFFNVLHYVTVRAMLAFLTALFASIFFGRLFINRFSNPFKSDVREYTPENHQKKNNTPTMGGIFILGSVIFSTLTWCNLKSFDVWIMLLCLILFGAIGFWDDYCKIRKFKGIFANKKFLLQNLFAFVVVLLWVYFCSPGLFVSLPLFKNYGLHLGALFIPWAVFVIISMSNAVNLTDGLDGLATTSLIYNFGTFALIAYLAGHLIISAYLHIPFTGSSELSVLACAFVGALIGFLWYNAYPAQVFMGDVGSLPLGACLALLALMTKQEILLPITGGVFLCETISVMLQVFWFKRFKKRLFKMAPIHHHFELVGWPESKITVRFATITMILCMISLMFLKIR